MLSRSTRYSGPALLLLVVALTSGCARSGFFVESHDLKELSAAVSQQQREIAFLQNLTLEQQRLILSQQDHSTDRIVNSIREQVEKPSCPPAQEQKACPTQTRSAEQKTRTDKLNGKLIVGELEKFFLVGPNFVYDARIDSGATTSSIDARNIKRFERNGENWVRFDVPIPGDEENFKTLERQIVRNVRIIQANEEDYDRRPVVELQFAMGDHQQKAEFTLTERAHMTHPILIGRNILRDVMLIDVGKEYATELPTAAESNDN